VLRFQGFLALIQHAIARGRAPTDDGLALLAAEAGYADQPHLNRECLRLTGVSPRRFVGQAERTCACGHVRRAAARLGALRANPQVAVSIDTESFPPEALLLRGRVAITEVDGVAPEYALAARPRPEPARPLPP
jgi:hypothetical protein